MEPIDFTLLTKRSFQFMKLGSTKLDFPLEQTMEDILEIIKSFREDLIILKYSYIPDKKDSTAFEGFEDPEKFIDIWEKDPNFLQLRPDRNEKFKWIFSSRDNKGYVIFRNAKL